MDLFRDNNHKIKKIFNPKRNSKNNPDDTADQNPVGRTLDRIVNAKEEARRQWEETEGEFERRRREHEAKMIEMEEAEIIRREKEIRDQQLNLDEQRRKNRLIQEQFSAQIRTLQEKLEEYKISHKSAEESLEDEISKKEDKLGDVKYSLEKRIQAMNMSSSSSDLVPSAPPKSGSFQSSDNTPNNSDIYPAIPNSPTAPEPSPQMSYSSRSDSPSDCSL